MADYLSDQDVGITSPTAPPATSNGTAGKGYLSDQDVGLAPPAPPSILGTTVMGALQGPLGYPESMVQSAERASGYHLPLWMRRPFIRGKEYAESTPEGQAAEFATSVASTLPFREAGFLPGAIASTFNQPIMGNVSDPEFARRMMERAAIGSIPFAGLTPLANRLEQNRQIEQRAGALQTTHQQQADRINRLNTAAQRQNLSDAAAHAQAQQSHAQAQQVHASQTQTHEQMLQTRAATEQARQAIPENVTRAWYTHIYDGTGVAPPVSAISPASISTIRRDIGNRLNDINSRLTYNPASHAAVLDRSNLIRQGLTAGGQAEWTNIYRQYVDPVMSERNVFSGRDYANYLSDLRSERERLARRASGQGGDSDDWKMVRGLRDIQNLVESQEIGSAADRAAKQTWRRAYGRAMIGDDATSASQNGVMTPQSIIKSWDNHTGDYGADYATNPVKQILARLNQQHQAQAGPVPRAPRAPGRGPGRGPGRFTPPFRQPQAPDFQQQAEQEIRGPPRQRSLGEQVGTETGNVLANIALWHLSPALGLGHMGYWLGHHTLNRLARNAAFQRALEQLARNRTPLSAAAGQATQFFDPNSVPNPYSYIPIPGGGVTP